MSQMVNVNFRLEDDVKKSMETVCAELGLSMSAAFTIFAKKVGREKGFPLRFLSIRFILREICDTMRRKCRILGRAGYHLQSMS